jgi:hypothetical protein
VGYIKYHHEIYRGDEGKQKVREVGKRVKNKIRARRDREG